METEGTHRSCSFCGRTSDSHKVVAGPLGDACELCIRAAREGGKDWVVVEPLGLTDRECIFCGHTAAEVSEPSIARRIIGGAAAWLGPNFRAEQNVMLAKGQTAFCTHCVALCLLIVSED